MLDFEQLDYYELLGVARDASAEEIKRAYRREISKYHPDRFVNAGAAEQEYAQRRSQALTEAHAVLSDFTARTAYNRGQGNTTRAGSTPRTVVHAAGPRDHQAELYEQAQSHLAAGRTLQAIGALRQLQQINPFYRDAATLLARAEEQLHQGQAAPPRRRNKVLPVYIAGGVAAVVIGIATVLALSDFSQVPATPATGAGQTAGVAPTPAVTAVAPQASAPPAPTSAPTAASTQNSALPAPTSAPTAIQTQNNASPQPASSPQPTAVQTQASASPAPSLAPTIQIPTATLPGGRLLLDDDFAQVRWAETRSNGWSVGYQAERYRITASAGLGTIWSYRSGATSNISLATDVQIASGEGGLLLRFVDNSNYLSFVVNPADSSYRFEQRSGGEPKLLAIGAHPAIRAGNDSLNRIDITLDGSRAVLRVNGEQLAEVDVGDAAVGQRFGLLAVAGTSRAEVYFDNLELRAIE